MQLGTSLPLALARRQKRVRDWKKLYAASTKMDAKTKESIAEKLGTYALLLAKLAGSVTAGTEGVTAEVSADAETKLLGLERELNSLFENHRLATDPDVGTRVATNPSFRPDMHSATNKH